MIIKYSVTDYSGKDVYLETFDEDEAITYQARRNRAMECYLNEEEVTYEDIQEMSDEERKQMYLEITGDELDEVDDDFWDWAEEEAC